MNPVTFPRSNVTYAKYQPQYRPLPAHYGEVNGQVTTCWRLTWKERIRVLLSGVVFHRCLTFDQPLQPMNMATRWRDL